MSKAGATYIEAVREALWEEMEADDRVFLLGEDIAGYGGAFKVTDGFLEHFGAKRIFDTPIAEAGIVGEAVDEPATIGVVAKEAPAVENHTVHSVETPGNVAQLIDRCGNGHLVGHSHREAHEVLTAGPVERPCGVSLGYLV